MILEKLVVGFAVWRSRPENMIVVREHDEEDAQEETGRFGLVSATREQLSFQNYKHTADD